MIFLIFFSVYIRPNKEEDKKPPDKCQDGEEKYAELSVKAFFDFMRTAYQVNESFQDIASTISANSQIDWNALTKFSMNNSDSGQLKNNAQDSVKEVKSTTKSLENVCTYTISDLCVLSKCNSK